MQQRSPYDRRRWKAKTNFPFRDSTGQLVREERRKVFDRRLTGTEAEWMDMIQESGSS